MSLTLTPASAGSVTLTALAASGPGLVASTTLSCSASISCSDGRTFPAAPTGTVTLVAA